MIQFFPLFQFENRLFCSIIKTRYTWSNQYIILISKGLLWIINNGHEYFKYLTILINKHKDKQYFKCVVNKVNFFSRWIMKCGGHKNLMFHIPGSFLFNIHEEKWKAVELAWKTIVLFALLNDCYLLLLHCVHYN